MKKLFLLILFSSFLFSCSTPKVKDYASYEVNGAWYWVLQFEADATEADVKEFVETWANINQTSYFFAYPKNYDLSNFKSKDLSFLKFSSIIASTPPKYGFYKMPNDSNIYDDAVWLMEQASK
ncbi:hypothetical protein [Pseudotamlana carrageenivorans]|uniref:Uncharacterized protein n=1 Tax=Pseudotamlana carrageenivorans TaxID=2069432 RepID=A0A2I7SKL1_9FLAO|nr:hypothetical protein [Tamlana carrageenivorans]AUS06465.1 hypothetical protein C1A40_13875 [Tamlana carrageenivorans]